MEASKMKPNNDLLREAYELQEILKSAKKRLDDIKDMVKPFGSYSTSEYSAMVKTLEVERLVGKDAFIEIYGRAELERQKLIHKNPEQRVSFERKLV